MDQNLLKTTIKSLPFAVIACLNDFRKCPTPPNEAYFVGYIKAKCECGCISEDEYTYLLDMVGAVIRGEQMRDLVQEAIRNHT